MWDRTHWHHCVPHRLLGIICPYVFFPCNLPQLSSFSQPSHEATKLVRQRQIFVRPSISSSTSPPQLLLRSLCYAARRGSKISIQASSGMLLAAPPWPQWWKVKKKQPKQKEKKWRKLRKGSCHTEHCLLSWGEWCYSRVLIQKLNSYLLFQKYIALLYIFHKWYRILHMFRFVFFKEELFSMLPPSSQTHTEDLATGLCSFFFPFKTHHTNGIKQIKKTNHTM